MTRERLVEVLTGLAAARPDELAPRLCRSCAEVVGTAGAGVIVMDEGGPQAPLCGSDRLATRIEDLQYTLGEGPSADAHRRGVPVTEPHLARPQRSRWPAFAPAAVAAGAEALFSFPLRLGGVRLGALTLHETHPGALSDDQHLDALAMADLVIQVVLARQAEAPPGALGVELETLSAYRAQVHQASGMVSAQLGVGVGEALVRLRAHAYADGRPLAAVAQDVVARRLRLAR